MWGAGGLMMLAFRGLGIAGAVRGLRALLDAGRRRHDSALEILRERYARGELTRDEFQARRRDLLHTPARGAGCRRRVRPIPPGPGGSGSRGLSSGAARLADQSASERAQRYAREGRATVALPVMTFSPR